MEQKQQPPYPLRIPVDLRSRLEKEAETRRRSLNAEISDRLEKSFYAGDSADGAIRAMAISLAEAQHDRTIFHLERETFLIHLATVCHMLEAAHAKLKELGAEKFTQTEEEDEFQEIRQRAFKELEHRTHVDPQELVDTIVASRKRLRSAQDAIVSSEAAEPLKGAKEKVMALERRRNIGLEKSRRPKPLG